MYFLLSGRFYTRGRNIRQYELGQTFLFRLVILVIVCWANIPFSCWANIPFLSGYSGYCV